MAEGLNAGGGEWRREKERKGGVGKSARNILNDPLWGANFIHSAVPCNLISV